MRTVTLSGSLVADIPQGYREIPEEDRKKALRFFEAAAAKADAAQYDYAINMYLDGLGWDPEAVEQHKALRELALKRKVSGGKPMGMFDKMKIKSSKDDKQNMLNAEKLLAYDPGERSYMADMFQNAIKAGCYDTALWIGALLRQANIDHPKSDIKIYFALRDGYKQMKQWRLAADATGLAVQMRPEDMDLIREQRDLATLDTMDKGNYEAGDFRKSMRDVEKQQLLIDQDKEIHSVDAMTRQIQDAEKEWRADPLETGKLLRYVDVLVKTEDPEYENKAIEVLEEAFKRSNQYRFRWNMLKIQMRQMDRMERMLRAEANDEARNRPTESKARQEYQSFAKEKNERELDSFNEASEQYPTDMSLKYEASRRLIRLGRHDEAIPLLQVVRNDPKYRIDGTVMLGQAFLSAGFADEACDTFAHAAEDYQIKGDPKSLDIFYWWGRSLEAKNPPDVPAALKCYSQVFQWNAAHLDVQQRIRKLRAGPAQPTT
jgi:predicted Zn-dependent protease